MLVEIERFVNWQRRRNPDARTWRDYGYDLKQFVACVGDVEPGSVTFPDRDRFVIAQAERGHKPCTINRRLAAITSLYTFLSDEDADLVCPGQPGAPQAPLCPTRPPPAARCAGCRHRAIVRRDRIGARQGDVRADVKMRLARVRGAQPLPGRSVPAAHTRKSTTSEAARQEWLPARGLPLRPGLGYVAGLA